MSLDGPVLKLQQLVDRLVRRLRLGSAPETGPRRRFLIVQIDGLSRSVLEQALAEGRMPFLRRLLERHRHELLPMCVGLPSSTPAFQMALMYGVRPDIPGFHYHDKRQRKDIYFPRAGDAAMVEAAHAHGRVGVLADGSAYGCVFTGGAVNNLFSFAMMKRPSGAGLLRAVSAFVVLSWVVVKCLALTSVEIVRALLRLVADPVGESARGWKWLGLKIMLSVWLRELFTLVTSRDLYAGVPAIYVNYLDYDVFGHAFGPRHWRSLHALRRLDRSIHQLWRVARRVPGHRYDLYVLSDHGQTASVPYQKVSGGRSFERVFFEDLLPAGVVEISPAHPSRRRLASGIKAFRRQRAPGMFQRFMNYLEKDFPWMLGQTPEARQQDCVRVIAAGPNAFVYFLDDDQPLTLEQIEQRFPGLADELSRSRGIGFVLARSPAGPVCLWRGKHYVVADEATGPLVGREEGPLAAQGIRDLMAMPSAGDLVIYGNDSPEGTISYVPEVGAHAGPSADELHTFIISPPDRTPSSPIAHPIELYSHFVTYRQG
ncbi:MAG TPA: alkaline phosphatase family protein [Methylomirabilota bacterium]|nr:alkaline phosphatase family protein [Methylomirabilota bacterium]